MGEFPREPRTAAAGGIVRPTVGGGDQNELWCAWHARCGARGVRATWDMAGNILEGNSGSAELRCHGYDARAKMHEMSRSVKPHQSPPTWRDAFLSNNRLALAR